MFGPVRGKLDNGDCREEERRRGNGRQVSFESRKRLWERLFLVSALLQDR